MSCNSLKNHEGGNKKITRRINWDTQIVVLNLSRKIFIETIFINRRWCRGEDLNFHRIAPTRPSSVRVYQFRHHGKERWPRECTRESRAKKSIGSRAFHLDADSMIQRSMCLLLSLSPIKSILMPMNHIAKPSAQTFHELAIVPSIMHVLDRLKFTIPTPIQHQAIPVALQGKDIIGIAQTGTGKTLAFGIPLLQRLSQGKGRALIVAPTRELAYQIEEALIPLASMLHIQTAVFVGGASMNLQRGMLRKNPRILIATPGRLNDHLEQGTVTLREVNILVLDEADRMLDMGFKPQIERILKHVPKDRQTLLFSATMPHDIVKLATQHMKLPLRIEVAPAGTAAANVEQELFIVKKEEKIRLLEKLLEEYTGTVLVFSRTKHGAKKITRSVRSMGHTSAEIHANRSLGQRREALEGFKSGKYRVLVATDIAARGIDVTGIAVVVNFDLPNAAEDYVHRIGRTARAGQAGRAISFASPDQSKEVRNIERLIRSTLRKKPLPPLPPPRAMPTVERDEERVFSPRPQRHAPRPARSFGSSRPSRSFGHSKSGGHRSFRRGR